MPARYTMMHGGRYKHRVLAEKAVGRSLPTTVPVHHVNGDGHDFGPGNLVVCENAAYHQLLHLRERALDACGNANWRKCIHCLQHDDPANLHILAVNVSGQAYHRACRRKDRRDRRALAWLRRAS